MNNDRIRALDSPQTYYQCFRDSNDAIAISDAKGIVVSVNRAFVALYGYSPEEVVGRSTRIIRSTHSTDEMYRAMWSEIADAGKGYWKGEIVNRKKNGEDVPVLLSITPIRDGGEIVGYMGIGIDISEQKKLEEFKRLYDNVMRHDLKTPLASIVSMMELVTNGTVPPESEKGRTFLERTYRRANEMLEIIASSLDMEKMSRGTFRANREDVAIRASAENVREALLPIAERKRVALKLDDRTGGDIVLKLDEIYFRRALENLVKNAVEASPPGETVVTGLYREAGKTVVAVSNRGGKIPAAVRATLFHPFSTYGKHGGTGLGLTGVKMAVEAMGGTVDYESEEGLTVFRMHFPDEQATDPR